MKKKITTDIERALVLELSGGNKVQFVCPEVTIGWYGRQRVDCLSMDCSGTFRCYEIKTSLADFRSKHGHSFVGHLNYYVMPYEVWTKLPKEKIPDKVGLFIASGSDKDIRFRLKKRPVRQDVAEAHLQKLKNSLIRSLHRESLRQYVTGEKGGAEDD